MPESIPNIEHRPEKLYYTIGEVADIFGLNTSLIRFWEKEFDILKPKKNKKGNRLFTQQDVDHFHLIYHLVKERGYTLDGARKYLKHPPEKIQADFEIVKSLKNIRQTLTEIRKEME